MQSCGRVVTSAGLRPCSKRHRRWSALLVTVLASSLLLCRLSTAFGHPEWSFWPWHMSWYMFAWDDGRLYKLQFEGRLGNGTEIRIDPSRWFKYPIGFETGRWNEFGRNPASVAALLTYLCRSYNESAGSGERLTRLRASDQTWPHDRGSRTRLEESRLTEVNPRFTPVEVGCP